MPAKEYPKVRIGVFTYQVRAVMAQGKLSHHRLRQLCGALPQNGDKTE